MGPEVGVLGPFENQIKTFNSFLPKHAHVQGHVLYAVSGVTIPLGTGIL